MLQPSGRVRVGGGIELAYAERGRGDAVVLVHGSLADLSYWQRSRQLELLSARHRVIAYSRRYNHPNRNAPSGDHSPLVEASDLAGLLDAFELDRVHLVGHSYGAYTALAYALEQPSRLRTLVLAEPPILAWLPTIPGGAGVKERFMERVWAPLATAFSEGGDVAGLELTARMFFGCGFDAMEPVWQSFYRDNVIEWRALARSPTAFVNLDQERVRGLRVPTLLLSASANAGGFNDLIDGQLHRLIEGAQRTVVPEASHEMFLDAPDFTARAMLDHVERHGAAVRS